MCVSLLCTQRLNNQPIIWIHCTSKKQVMRALSFSPILIWCNNLVIIFSWFPGFLQNESKMTKLKHLRAIFLHTFKIKLIAVTNFFVVWNLCNFFHHPLMLLFPISRKNKKWLKLNKAFWKLQFSQFSNGWFHVLLKFLNTCLHMQQWNKEGIKIRCGYLAHLVELEKMVREKKTRSHVKIKGFLTDRSTFF